MAGAHDDAEQRLGRYRSKRHFDRTPEPSGATGTDRSAEAVPGTAGASAPASPAAAPVAPSASAEPSGTLRFVVQRHRARRLHYDFRLEMDGVLASWAVPKGPTLDPGVRRLAVHVEDHPMEYAAFEGVIPGGQYGGGDVIVWDTGTWEPNSDEDPATAVAAGELHVTLHGQRLKGRFALVRTGDAGSTGTGKATSTATGHGTAAGAGHGTGTGAGTGTGKDTGNGKEQWLLLHKHDEFAVDGWDAEDHPTSVLSGRTNDQVAAAPDRLWQSGLPATQAEVDLRAVDLSHPTPDELAELDALGTGGTWHVHGRSLKVTNLDKVLFPARRGEPPVTKRDLLRYAARIGPVVLPYLTGRPLNLHRYPQGADKPGFWHKQLPDHAPDWLSRWDNPDADDGETTTYLVVDEPAALVWAANFGGLEWHAWTSTTAHPRLPSYAMVDLDPGTSTRWEDLLAMARLHRDAFAHLGVRAYPKLTGRRGIQVWIPVAEGPSFDETRDWVERVSRTVGAVVPDLVSWRWEVRERGGKARLDYTQNAVNKTLVAPYSPRPAAGAPVSTPITWDELDKDWLAPDAFTLRTVLDRIAERGDPFRGVLLHDQTLPRLG